MKFDQTLPESCSTALEVLQYMHAGGAQDFISGLSWRTRPTPHCPEMRENRERVAAQLIFNWTTKLSNKMYKLCPKMLHNQAVAYMIQ